MDHNAHLELLCPYGDSGPIHKFIEKKGEGIHHLCFKVPNVEDDLEVLDVIKMYLEDIDANKQYFSDSLEALKTGDNQEVDLLITDIFMPKMNGLEFISAYREKRPDCKIIAISAGGETGGFVKSLVLDEALAQGANSAIKKPFLQEDLINEIKRLFS